MLQAEFQTHLIETVTVYNSPGNPKRGPSDEVRKHVGQAEVFVLMGPSGIGKNTQKARLIEAVGRMGGKLAVQEMASITTREKRPEEEGEDGVDPYLWHCDISDSSDQDKLMSMFDNREIVQAAVHEETGVTYASLDRSYTLSTPDTRVINLADFMFSEYARLAKLGLFRRQFGAYLGAADNDQWMDLWGIRDSSKGLDGFLNRLCEAERSTGSFITAEEIVAGSIKVVRHNYSDAIDSKTGMTQTVGSLYEIMISPDDYDDSADRGSVRSMHEYVRGIQRGFRIAHQHNLLVA